MRHLILLAVALSLVALTGCGGERRVSVAGNVTLDGEPIPEGSITFIPDQGNHGPTAGGEIIDGEYRVESASGPMTGPHRVEIRATVRTGRSVPDPRFPGARIEEVRDLIPARYKTGKPEGLLTCNLQAGDNTVNLNLTSR
jgi:hypothetical protein